MIAPLLQVRNLTKHFPVHRGVLRRQVGAVRARVRLGHSSDVKRLAPTLREFRPTFVLAVPRVFEKVFTTASQRATADGRGPLFDRAAETAIAWSRSC